MMKDPTTTTIAIIITGIEEGLFRSTLVERDLMFRKWRGLGRMTKEEEDIQKLVWAASISSSMIAELVAICVRVATILLFWRHRYIFNIHGAVDQEGELNKGLLFINLILELTSEYLVDNLAIKNELEHDIPLKKVFTRMLRWEISVLYTFMVLASVLITLCTFMSLPTFIFCTSPNPCSCNGAGFAIYNSFCINRTSNASNTSVAMHLAEREESNPLVYLDQDDLVTVVVALVSLLCFMAVMQASSQALKRRKECLRVLALDDEVARAVNMLGEQKDEIEAMRNQIKSKDNKIKQYKLQLASLSKAIKEVFEEGGSQLDQVKVDYNNLTFVKALGEGAFGSVWKGEGIEKEGVMALN